MGKQLMSNTANITLAPDNDGKLEAIVELVLICAEASYSHQITGIKKDYTLETLRFELTPTSCMELSKRLIELAEDAETLADSYQLKKKD